MPQSKLVSLTEAIARYVQDGSAIALGAAQEILIPFAAGRELIRQRKHNLTLIGPISDILFDQLIGAGCVREIRAAWVGNVITGSGYNFRRAIESGAVTIQDHSNLTLALALKAGAMGVPFLPTRTALGSDLFRTNSQLTTTHCPFTGDTLTAVAALNPDVTIIHAQRADEFGNAHVWGNLSVTREACLASHKIIITTEEIVAPETINSDPNRIVTPGFRVSAVVHAPWGAHPSPVPGYYNRDHQTYLDYARDTRTPHAFETWRAQWVDDADYVARVGMERLENLKLKNHALAAAVDYGY